MVRMERINERMGGAQQAIHSTGAAKHTIEHSVSDINTSDLLF